MKRISLVVIATIVFLMSALPAFAKEQETSAIQDQELANVQAFAKLYGYVRFFHPSDENEKIDWHRFAIHGVSKVRSATTNKELTTTLHELFYPVAPTMSLSKQNNVTMLSPPKQAKNLTAWLHISVKMNSPQEQYTSERLQSVDTSQIKLLNHVLQPGETTVKRIATDLFAHIPIVLYRNDSGTIGATPQSTRAFTQLQQQLSRIDLDKASLDDPNVQLANFVITWNAIQHFYPYFDVVKVDWEQALTEALQESLNKRTADQFVLTMKQMLANLQDGHNFVIASGLTSNVAFSPYSVQWIEEQVVVTNVKEGIALKPGDVILTINGREATSYYKELEGIISGSEQYKRVAASRHILQGVKGKEAKLTVQRGEHKFDIAIPYTDRTVDEFIRPAIIEQVEDGIYYINLAQLTKDMFKEKLPELGKAKGVIFDLRGYPYPGSIGKDILPYLTDAPLKTPQYHIPLTVYPDREKVTFNPIQYTIQPLQPKLKGKIVFLTYGGAISYSETIMGIVEHHRLAEIVGQPTAGANGDVNLINLPGGCTVAWTGLVTLKQDGSQHHLIGIQPTVPVERTIKEVSEGRDIYLEKAIETINGEKK
ncbi:S41 family peptidase [Paenibacillus sp. N3/727]|uniref:S41 family peptidase n=1 Tax=Paenibacillus sp. N3/727 TaxID=2925845 RepID=UPI001F53B8D2|nr:S41 family peptidase [Paenibacillus sp. N3/727]UNK15851.1 S41 family peptidase [Paenibacillus sp. N3/727]